MIIGIGTDIIQVDRMKIYLKNETWKKVFTEKEYEYALSKRYTLQHLAGMWAAKEAAYKADAVATPDLKFDFDPLFYEVRHRKNGAPYIWVTGVKHSFVFHLSISHEKDFAIAYVILEEKV